MATIYTQKEAEFLTTQLSLRFYELTEWEQGFIDSIKGREARLSPKQAETLSRIWEKY